MSRSMRGNLLLMVVSCLMVMGRVQAQTNLAELAKGVNGVVLPVPDAKTGGVEIVGPAVADLETFVHLEVTGLPSIDTSQTLDEALRWTKTIAMQVHEPPESLGVDFETTLGFKFAPSLQWKLTLDLCASAPGDYVVSFAMPGEDADDPVQLAMHGVRYGGGPVPPVPDPVLSLEPEKPFVSQGPEGGPFDPPSMTYMLANTGQGTLRWTAGSTVAWVEAVPSMGTLAAGQSISVLARLSSEAASLPGGLYVGALNFDNETNDKGSTIRLVSLKVSGDPPPPPVQELWGLVVYETDDLDDYGPKIAQVLASKRIREHNSKFHWHLFDKDVETEDGKVPEQLEPWLKMIDEKNLSMPHLFLVSQAGDLVNNKELPDSVDAVLEMVDDYLPKKGEPE